MLNTVSQYSREFFDLPGLARHLLRHGELIASMTWRDFGARYRGSFGGLVWSVFQPLVMMVIYTLVFSVFLKVKFTSDSNPFEFSVYLLCGLLPWNALSESLTQSTQVIRSNVNLVKRVVFPLEILPLNLALAAAIQQLIGFALLVPLAWLVTGQLQASLLFVPVILVLQLLFVTGMNWLAASLAVYLPDLRHVISLVLMVWMFLTPVVYPEDVVPAHLLILFRLNPMARIVTLYRNAFMTGLLPSPRGLVGAVALCLLVFMAGYFWFMRTKRGFADVL
jgi:homopolymeric O-antigen transport system permease protein